MPHPLVVAITGASGAIYAVRLLEVLVRAGRELHLSISPSGAQVLEQELHLHVDIDHFSLESLLPHPDGLPPDSPLRLFETGDEAAKRDAIDLCAAKVAYHHYQDFSAPIASGSSRTAGMVVCPCSMSTLAGIAGGLSSNLIQRAVDVHLKERRRLIVVPRETPLSVVQLENLRRAAEAGAVVLPAMPGYYHGPRRLSDLVDFIVGRVCDQLEVEHHLFRRWGETDEGSGIGHEG
jgi:4-hydroxy-3-polyprenylbenzoate decarboxylase